MKRHHMRRFTGLALTVLIMAGCRSGTVANDPGLHRFPEPFKRSVLTRSAHITPAGDVWGTESLPTLGEGSSLDDYLRYAALNNPGVEAAFQIWNAELERAPQASALPDPRITYGHYLSEVETRIGSMEQSLGLSQTFPWFGKLQDREDAATRNANAAHQRFEAARLALSYRVERAFNELYFLKQSIEITRENLGLVQQFERIAQSRYRVAAASHPDVIRVQVELGVIEDRLRQLIDLRAPLSARLNAALNRAPDAPLPWPASVADRIADVDESTLHEALRLRNPELLALQEEIERERIGAEIARKDGLPDLTVGLTYTVIDERPGAAIAQNGDDAVLATFSMNIPLWRGKYDAGVRESIARRLGAANRRAERANLLDSELEEAIYEHKDSRRRVGLYRGTLIPKSTESLEASLSGFQQGTVDFQDLIDTERTLLEFQLGLERALVDRATSYARIERLIGTRLMDLNERTTP